MGEDSTTLNVAFKVDCPFACPFEKDIMNGPIESARITAFYGIRGRSVHLHPRKGNWLCLAGVDS